MKRVYTTFPIADLQQTKLQMLNWAKQFNICVFLDNHQYSLSHHSIECLLAVGASRQLEANAGNALDQLQIFANAENDWLFGHLSFDLKNEIEWLSSSHSDGVEFPDLFFFIPEIVIQLYDDRITLGVREEEAGKILQQILSCGPAEVEWAGGPVEIKCRIPREEYISIIKKLQQHILRGDCYEINYCQEFYAENVFIDPLSVYCSLSQTSPNPFSAFYRLNGKYLLCASPERYLKKENNTLLSQPIKGTWQRDLLNEAEDKRNQEKLYGSSKDRSENVMVVDLVRNDLSKVCEVGTVKVDELFGIYSFPQVHQMISTVSGFVKKEVGWIDAIKATFPMGSMTGAPKKKVLQLIEQYEKTKRGIFSGALGYVSPGGDFDFNVVIRSILYNASNGYLSFQTGSGITFYSDPEKEYEECLLKAAAIKKVLAG